MNRSRLAHGLLAAVVAVGTLGLAGAAAADESTGATPSGAEDLTFTVGMQQDIDSINPFSMITASAYEVSGLMYDTLTGYGVDFQPEPRLAAEMPTVSDDGLTWTFPIREGVKWSDGEPLTADDVAYTFNRIKDGGYEKTNYGNYVRNITKVVATDDYTVVMTTKKPTPNMTKLLVPILPEHIWKDIDSKEVKTFTNEPDLDNGAIGSGPFILTEARNNQFYTLERNPDYWGPKQPTIDQVTFRVFKNAEAEALALRNGEIDFADDVDANVFKALEGVPGITARQSVYYGFNYLTMNTGAQTVSGKPIGDGNPALEDPVVREAIAMAVDKQTLVDRALGGFGEPGTTIIPPLYPFHQEPPEITPFDLDQANQLLDDAGYKMGADGVRTMPAGGPNAGEKLVLRLWGRQESESSKKTVQFVAEWLKDIGIQPEVKIVSEDFLYEAAGQGEYDIYEWGWVVEPDPDYQLSTMTCGQMSYEDGGTVYAGLNDSFFCDKKYDDLYEQQAVEIDEAKRTDIVKQMQQIVYDANPYIVTFYYDYLQAYRTDSFTGFVAQPPPDGAILFQYGIFSYLNIRPVEETTSSGGSSNNAGLIVGMVALVAVVGVGAFLIGRRRTSSDDIE